MDAKDIINDIRRGHGLDINLQDDYSGQAIRKLSKNLENACRRYVRGLRTRGITVDKSQPQ